MMIAREGRSVADETISAHNARELMDEVERSRESAARLLETLAEEIGSTRAARYVHTHSVQDVALEIERAVRRSPARAIAIAVVAGFLAGRVLRSR